MSSSGSDRASGGLPACANARRVQAARVPWLRERRRYEARITGGRRRRRPARGDGHGHVVDDRALVDRRGFWTPLNLIAHTVWRDAPTDATFSVGGLLLGGAVHMMMSIILGVVLVWLAEQVRATPAVLVLGGMGYGLVVWLVNQYIVWPAIDPTAAAEFTPWVFAVGHLMYGVVAAIALLPQLGSRAAGRTHAPAV